MTSNSTLYFFPFLPFPIVYANFKFHNRFTRSAYIAVSPTLTKIKSIFRGNNRALYTTGDDKNLY